MLRSFAVLAEVVNSLLEVLSERSGGFDRAADRWKHCRGLNMEDCLQAWQPPSGEEVFERQFVTPSVSMEKRDKRRLVRKVVSTNVENWLA